MKRRLLVLVLFTCLLITACSKSGEKNVSEDPVPTGEPSSSENTFVCVSFFRQGFVTENYVLYHGADYQLRLFDAASRTDIPFCFDPACEHAQEIRSRKGELLQEGCVSYNFSTYPVMLRGENYFFLNAETGEVIRSDRQGENRKVIGTIPKYILPHKVFFSEDKIFVTYANSYEMIETKDKNGETQWVVGDPKPTNTCGIVMVDLETGEYSELLETEDYSAQIIEYDVRGGHLYFQRSYSDIPYISPDLETDDPSLIPEGMTVENYWEELPKHMWMDIYDFNIATGELRAIQQDQQYGEMGFCNGFFAVSEPGGTTGLYRYSGERFRELDFPLGIRTWSDRGLVCTSSKNPDEYLLIDENTGEIIRRTTIPGTAFRLEVMIGESCYGYINGKTAGYLPTEDFWAGNTAKAVAFEADSE